MPEWNEMLGPWVRVNIFSIWEQPELLWPEVTISPISLYIYLLHTLHTPRIRKQSPVLFSLEIGWNLWLDLSNTMGEYLCCAKHTMLSEVWGLPLFLGSQPSLSEVQLPCDHQGVSKHKHATWREQTEKETCLSSPKLSIQPCPDNSHMSEGVILDWIPMRHDTEKRNYLAWSSPDGGFMRNNMLFFF